MNGSQELRDLNLFTKQLVRTEVVSARTHNSALQQGTIACCNKDREGNACT